MTITGKVSFDYSTNSGICVIGEGDACFETKWSRAGNGSIYLYRDPPSIKEVAIAAEATAITNIHDATRFDFTSRCINPENGQIVILKNVHGHYAALRITGIKAKRLPDKVDEVRARS